MLRSLLFILAIIGVVSACSETRLLTDSEHRQAERMLSLIRETQTRLADERLADASGPMQLVALKVLSDVQPLIEGILNKLTPEQQREIKKNRADWQNQTALAFQSARRKQPQSLAPSLTAALTRSAELLEQFLRWDDE
jgi:hypothetical protein